MHLSISILLTMPLTSRISIGEDGGAGGGWGGGGGGKQPPKCAASVSGISGCSSVLTL